MSYLHINEANMLSGGNPFAPKPTTEASCPCGESGWTSDFDEPHYICPGCAAHPQRNEDVPILSRYSGGVGSHSEHEFHCTFCHTTWEEMYQMDKASFGCHSLFEVELGPNCTEQYEEEVCEERAAE